MIRGKIDGREFGECLVNGRRGSCRSNRSGCSDNDSNKGNVKAPPPSSSCVDNNNNNNDNTKASSLKQIRNRIIRTQATKKISLDRPQLRYFPFVIQNLFHVCFRYAKRLHHGFDHANVHSCLVFLTWSASFLSVACLCHCETRGRSTDMSIYPTTASQIAQIVGCD